MYEAFILLISNLFTPWSEFRQKMRESKVILLKNLRESLRVSIQIGNNFGSNLREYKWILAENFARNPDLQIKNIV